MRPVIRLLSLCTVVTLGACTPHEVHTPIPAGGGETFNSFDQDREVALDILFVIDDSGSMEDEQASLAARFSELSRALEALPGGLPSVHIGVVSSSVGTAPFSSSSCPADNDDGRFRIGARSGSSCQLDAGSRFLVDERLADGTRKKNYQGALDQVFACMARLGTQGCQFEQHLEAMKRALSPGLNPDFLRPDSYLVVIVLADEDDCSARAGAGLFDPDPALGGLDSYRCFEHGVVCSESLSRQNPGVKTGCRSNESSPLSASVQGYVDFLRGLKGDRVITAAIVGGAANVRSQVVDGNADLASVCSGNGQRTARPSVRLAQFIGAFQDAGVVTSICADDFTPALRAIADVITRKVASPCVKGEVLQLPPDDPVATPVEGAGFGVWCTVTDVGAGRADDSLPACADGAGKPCWRAVLDPVKCPAATSPAQLEIQIDREPTQSVVGLESQVRCLTPLPGARPTVN